MGAAHSILQCLALSLPEERRDGSAQSPKREIGASSHCATRGQQGNRSWLGCSPTGATSAIAGIDVIGIHGDGGIQGYYSPTSDVGAVIQRNALVRDNAPIEVSGCPQGHLCESNSPDFYGSIIADQSVTLDHGANVT